MKHLISTLTLLLIAQVSWAQTRVDISSANYYEDPSGTISFDLVAECTQGDTAFLAFGDIVFTAEWSEFTNPTLVVTSLGTATSRNGNTNLNPGFIRLGSQQNDDKVVYSFNPMFIDTQNQFNDNVIALERGVPTPLVHIEVQGYTGILDPNFEWVKTGGSSENVCNLHAFSTRTPKFVTDKVELRFTDFPSLSSPRLAITAFLEGPYDVATGEMRTDLNSQGLLPLSHPYSGAPWNYTGTESVSAIPNADVVDWVLVEIRETNNASSASIGTSLGKRAAFILKDGRIVDLDGSSYLDFENATFDTTKEQYVVLYHRNHLAMMCSDGMHYVDSVPPIARWECNMTSGLNIVYGGANGAKLKGGYTMLIAGDAEGSSQIQNADKNLYWNIQVGASGYLNADFDMNGQVQNTDKNLIWKENVGKGSQVL